MAGAAWATDLSRGVYYRCSDGLANAYKSITGMQFYVQGNPQVFNYVGSYPVDNGFEI